MDLIAKQILTYGNCGIVRLRGKAAYGKDMSPQTGTWYKADGMGELAPHSEALGSVSEVNHGFVYRNSVFLPREVPLDGKGRFRSTAKRFLGIEVSCKVTHIRPYSVNSVRRSVEARLQLNHTRLLALARVSAVADVEKINESQAYLIPRGLQPLFKRRPWNPFSRPGRRCQELEFLFALILHTDGHFGTF